MHAVWQKIKADIVSRPFVSLLITLTIVSAATLLTLALATLLNLSEPYRRSFETLNAAHLWLYFDRGRMRARDVERIEALPGIVESTGLRYSKTSRVRIGDTRVWVSVRMLPPQPRVNQLLIQAGRDLLPHEEEVLASRDLDDLYGLAVGETLGLDRYDGERIELPVIGLAYNPMWDTYRNTQPPYVYVNEDTMRMLYPDETLWSWSMGVRLADPEAVDATLAQIKRILPQDAVAGHTDWHDVQRSANFGARLNFILLGAFSVFAILATVLVIVSSISSFVLSQFRQVGVLKAVGFTRRQVLLLYTGQYLAMGLVGTPLGLLLGIALAPLPLRNIASSLSTTFRPPLNPWIVALVLTLLPLVIVLATLRSASRAAEANIVKAIATGAEAPPKRTFWIARLAQRLGAPMPLVLGLNDVFAKPLRSLMTGLNLTLGVIGIVFGLTLNETIELYKQNPPLLGIAYDAMLTRQATPHSKVRHLLGLAPGVQAYYGETLVDVETPAGHAFQVRAVEGDVTAFPIRILRGRFFRPAAYEAIAGQGLLDWLDLRVGDTLTVVLDEKRGRTATWRIVGTYTEPVNVGQMLMVGHSTLARLIDDPLPRTYYLKLAPGASPTRLKRYLEPREDADLNFTLAGQAIPSVIVYLQLALFLLSGILIGIALVNVFNTSLLAVYEKLRMIGVLKTLGLTPRQVMGMIHTTSGFLGFLATLVGLPLGWVFTRSLLVMMSRTYGFGQVQMPLNPLYVLVLPVVMVGVSMLGSLFPGRRAARVAIVSVLRRE
jgi:putative ABC transport system permease protein